MTEKLPEHNQPRKPEAPVKTSEVQKPDPLKAEIAQLEAHKAELQKTVADLEKAAGKAKADAAQHKAKALTAAQIKQMLSPLVGFMPAMMAASDIVESAEKAEAKIKDYENQKIPIQKEMDDFVARRQQYEKQFLTVRADYHKEMEPLEQSKIRLKDEVSKLSTEHDRLNRELEDARVKGDREIKEQHEKVMKKLESERQEFATRIESERAELQSTFDRVKKDFTAFKTEHKLG